MFKPVLMERITVVAGICYRQDNFILLGQRQECEGSYAGYWEFPGGKIEEGESDRDALRREFSEELGCDVIQCEKFYFMEWVYPERTVELRFYLVRLSCEETSKLELNAHSQLSWVNLDEALSLPVLPANTKILKELLKQKERLLSFVENEGAH